MPTLSAKQTENFSNEMKIAYEKFKIQTQQGESPIDEKEAQSRFPDIIVSPSHFHISDLQFARRQKAMQNRCLLQQSTDAALKRETEFSFKKVEEILRENEMFFGPAHKTLTCQLTLMEEVEKACRARNDNVGIGVAVAMKEHLLKNKTDEQKIYEQTYTAIEQVLGITPQNTAVRGKNFLADLYPEAVGDEEYQAIENDQGEGVVLSDYVGFAYEDAKERQKEFQKELSTMSQVRAMRQVANCAVTESENFAKMISGQISAVAPRFDWSYSVFIGEQTLHDRTTEVMKEQNIAPNLRSLVTASVLSSAIMNQNQHVYVPVFNDTTKRFETDKLIRIEAKGVNKEAVTRNPKMNPWQRLWSHFGRYKDTLKLQKEFDLQQSIKDKIQPLNDEIEREIVISDMHENLTEITQKANLAIDIGNSIYAKVEADKKENLTDADRIMASGMAASVFERSHLLSQVLNPQLDAQRNDVNAAEKDRIITSIAGFFNVENQNSDTWKTQRAGFALTSAVMFLAHKPDFDLNNGLFAAGDNWELFANVAFQGKYFEQLAVDMLDQQEYYKDVIKGHRSTLPVYLPAFGNDDVNTKFEKLHDIIAVTAKLYNGMTDGYLMMAKDRPNDFLQPQDDAEHIASLSNALFVKNVANLKDVDPIRTDDTSLFARNVANSKDFKEIDRLPDLTYMKTTTVNKLLNMSNAITAKVRESADSPKETQESRMLATLERNLSNPVSRLHVEDLSDERNIGYSNVSCDLTELEMWEPMTTVAKASKKEMKEAVKAAALAEATAAAATTAAVARANPNADKALEYDQKVNALLHTVFSPEGEDKNFFTFYHQQPNRLSPLSATIAYLTIEKDMTIDEILNKDFGIKAKQDAREEILGLYDNFNFDAVGIMTDAAISFLAKQKNPDELYAKTSPELRKNYDKIRLMADFNESFSQLYYRNRVLDRTEESMAGESIIGKRTPGKSMAEKMETCCRSVDNIRDFPEALQHIAKTEENPCPLAQYITGRSEEALRGARALLAPLTEQEISEMEDTKAAYDYIDNDEWENVASSSTAYEDDDESEDEMDRTPVSTYTRYEDDDESEDEMDHTTSSSTAYSTSTSTSTSAAAKAAAASDDEEEVVAFPHVIDDEFDEKFYKTDTTHSETTKTADAVDSARSRALYAAKAAAKAKTAAPAAAAAAAAAASVSANPAAAAAAASVSANPAAAAAASVSTSTSTSSSTAYEDDDESEDEFDNTTTTSSTYTGYEDFIESEEELEPLLVVARKVLAASNAAGKAKHAAAQAAAEAEVKARIIAEKATAKAVAAKAAAAAAYDQKVKTLLNTIFSPEGEDKNFFTFYHQQPNRLSPISATVAYLTTHCLVPIDQIFNKDFGEEEKKDVREGILKLYDNFNFDAVDTMTEAALNLLYLQKSPDELYAKTSPELRNNYDEIRLMADFNEGFSQLYYRNRVLDRTEESRAGESIIGERTRGKSMAEKIEDLCRNRPANLGLISEEARDIEPTKEDPYPLARYITERSEEVLRGARAVLAPLTPQELSKMTADKAAEVASKLEDEAKKAADEAAEIVSKLEDEAKKAAEIVSKLKDEAKKAPEQKAAEQKAPEQKAPEQKAPEQKAPEQKAPEQKAQEQKAASGGRHR